MNAFTPTTDYGYGANTNMIRPARDVEYDIFSRVTRMLRQADRRGRSPATIGAVHKNNELWTILAADLADPANALPDEVKAGLLSLAGFSIRHGHQVIAGNADTDALIEINLSVMKGLRTEAAA